MKRVISLAVIISIILSLLIPFSVLGAEETILLEESFENGIEAWKKATTKTSEEIAKITTDKATDGKNSLYIIDQDTTTAFGYKTGYIPAKGNTTYKLYADLFYVEGTGSKVFLTFYDSTGTKLEASSTYTRKNNEWETVCLEMVSPKDTAKLVVSLMGASASTGITYLDNIKLIEQGGVAPSVSTPNVPTYKDGDLILSENFENGAPTWKISSIQYADKIRIVDDLYSEGSKSLRISDDVTDKAIGFRSSKIPVKAGSQITVAMDWYTFYGTSVQTYVRMYDEDNKSVFSKAFKGKGRKWTLATLVCDVPATAATFEIYISGISTSQGDSCVDNVRVYQGKVDVKSDFSKSLADSEGEKEFTFESLYDMPSFEPTEGHPRLYFNKNDIETIKKNSTHPQNSSAYSQFMKEVNSTEDGHIATESGNNVSGKIMSIIQSKAFYYAVWGDEAKGREAISSLYNFLEDANIYESEYNAQGFLVFTISAVYDWCYPLLTEEDKKTFQNKGLIVSSSMEIGFPPKGGSVLNAHAAEAQLQRDQMAFAIAVYDERKDIYQNIAGRYFKEMVDSKIFLAQSHSSLFGNSYSTYRYQWEVLSVYMMRALGIENIFGEEHGKVLYWNLYARRPDGSMLRDGDSVSDNQAIGPYDERGTRAYFLAGNCYKDPYLKGEALRHNNGIIIGETTSNQSLSSIEVLCFNDPSVGYSSVKELPLSKYFPTPRGEMIARTSWAEGIDAPSVVAQLNIGEYWTQGHDHLDSGEFEIYYKGALATDTGYYQAGRDGSTAENSGNTVAGTVHYYNYHRRTIAHNCMLVIDPDENTSLYNNHVADGGQIFASGESSVASVHDLLAKEDTNRVGIVLGREIGTDTINPDYTYIKGDLQNAYGEKVSEYERSFMFLNHKNNDHPATIIVFDRVVSNNPSFDKKWILHSLGEPEISGTRTVLKNTKAGYNGKLTVDTLLPKKDNLDIKAVGGKDSEYMVNGTNYWAQALANKINEGGGYRMEVSPRSDSKEDYFLNVLQVGDQDKDTEPLETEMIESETHTGVKIADRVVMFGKKRDRVSGDVKFTVSGNGWFKYNVADLKEGTWLVKKDNVDLTNAVATKDGGVVSFEAGAGEFTLTYIGEGGEKVFTSVPQPYTEGINIKLEPDNIYIYSDVDPFTVNGRTLIPMRAIFEALKAKVSWDEATKTATGEKNGKIIKITEDSSIALVDGKEVTLDSPAIIKNGRFVVPVRFVAESFGIPVSWDDFSKTVIIKTSQSSNIEQFIGVYKPNHNIENALTLYSLQQTGDDGAGNNVENIFDGSFTTGWGLKEDEKGDDGYGIFDLGEVKTLNTVSIAYRMGDSRIYKFSIFVSEDGKKYTPVLVEAQSSGKTLEFETYDLKGAKGRYIKYVGHGNSSNAWSNMAEMVFTGK